MIKMIRYYFPEWTTIGSIREATGIYIFPNGIAEQEMAECHFLTFSHMKYFYVVHREYKNCWSIVKFTALYLDRSKKINANAFLSSDDAISFVKRLESDLGRLLL